MGILDVGDIARKLDHRDLHAKTDAEIRYAVFPGVFGGAYHALDAALAEAARDDNAVHLLEHFIGDGLGVQPFNIDPCAAGIARVAQRLGYAQIRVVQLHIFADQADGDGIFAAFDTADRLLPVAQIGRSCLDIQAAADGFGKARFFEHERSLIEHGQS